MPCTDADRMINCGKPYYGRSIAKRRTSISQQASFLRVLPNTIEDEFARRPNGRADSPAAIWCRRQAHLYGPLGSLATTEVRRGMSWSGQCLPIAGPSAFRIVYLVAWHA